MEQPKTSRKKLSLGSLPFIFAEGIFGYVYFTFIKYLSLSLLRDNLSLAMLELSLFHVFFILAQTSFFKTTFTDPGEIPEDFMQLFETPDIVGNDSGSINSSEHEHENENDNENDNDNNDNDTENNENPSSPSTRLIVPVAQERKSRKKGGGRRQCKKCMRAKPDRAHHCSTCKRCTLKMDHHCPWVNNCVGFYNYKFFVLFLSWTVILAVFVAACLLDPCFQLSSGEKRERDPLLFVTFVLAAIFGIGLGLFAITHYAYLFMNQTTIEVMEKNTNLYVGNIYNIGAYHNFTQVFGDSPLLWLIPVYSSKGNGLTFPTRPSAISMA